MKKLRVFYLVAILVASAVLLSVVNAQAVSEEARRHMARGEVAMEMAKSPEDYEAAIWEFQEAARLAPDWADPYYKLGLAQEKEGKLREAIASLNRYLQLAPNATDAAKVKELIYKLEYRMEKAQRELMDPNNLVGLWSPDEDNGGAFVRFEIRNNNGKIEGGLRAYAFTEESGLGRRPWFVPIQWDGKSLVISHTKYFYCDKSVRTDCCPSDASLSLIMIAKDTFKGTIQIGPDNSMPGTTGWVTERIWKRIK